MTARNTTVQADANAPAVTALLAHFVANHPSKGWTDEVEQQAHRTFANWAGCAVGPSTHETVTAALAASRVDLALGCGASRNSTSRLTVNVSCAWTQGPDNHPAPASKTTLNVSATRIASSP